jgi:photosystem II stability/assembly factor-like uncharacterized protein
LDDAGVLNLVIDPISPETVYAGTFSGGIFKTIDGGANWLPMRNGLTATLVNDIAVDWADSLNVYAATPWGLFKTSDGGGSWRLTGRFAPLGVSALSELRGIPRIYAGAGGFPDGGVFRTYDGGTSWDLLIQGLSNRSLLSLAAVRALPDTLYAGTQSGVFKTENGGTLWMKLNGGLPEQDYFDVRSVAIDPISPSTVYLGTGRGVFKTTNGGLDWTLTSDGLTERIVLTLAIHPASPSTLYAGTIGGIFKTEDAGRTWASVRSFQYEGVAAIAIDPSAPATVYAGTHYSGPSPSAGPIYSGSILKSTNGGVIWFEIGSGLPHPYVAALRVDPTSTSSIYAGTSSGVFRSSNGGGSWSALNDGLPEYTFIYSLAFDPTSPSTLYAGTQTGAYKITLSESLGVPGAIPTLNAKVLTALGLLLATIGFLLLRR